MISLAAAIIMATMYGHDVAPNNDHFVDLAEDAMSHMSGGFSFTNSLLHSFPIIRYFPSFLPGLAFKRFALEGKRSVLDMLNIPLGIVQSKIVRPCTSAIKAFDDSPSDLCVIYMLVEGRNRS